MQYDYMILLAGFLLGVKLWLLCRRTNEYYDPNVFAHFGGIPNDSQLWGYQTRTIF